MTLVVAARCLMFRPSSERELLAVVAGPEPDCVASDACHPKALILGSFCRFSRQAVDAGAEWFRGFGQGNNLQG